MVQNYSANKIVLVIEDSVTQALRARMLLEQENLYVLLATDGEMGLRMARQLHPDLILLDLELPRLNGRQVFQELRAARDTADIPVIIFTKCNDPELFERGTKVGIVNYIPKDAFASRVLLETMYQMGLISEQPKDILSRTWVSTSYTSAL